MNNTYILKKPITASLVGNDNKLRFDTLLSSFQDLATLHSREMGVGFDELLKSSNAIWIVTKIKICVAKMPSLYENVEITSYPTSITPLTFIREFTLTGDMGGSAVGHSEWCVLDATSKTLRRSNSIVYPFDMPHRTDGVNLTFDKMRQDNINFDFSYSHTVRLTDIDCNEHTNNVAYVKMALNAFSALEFNSHGFTSLEVKFSSQSYYGDEISIFKAELESGKFFIIGKIEEKTVFSIILS